MKYFTFVTILVLLVSCKKIKEHKFIAKYNLEDYEEVEILSVLSSTWYHGNDTEFFCGCDEEGCGGLVYDSLAFINSGCLCPVGYDFNCNCMEYDSTCISQVNFNDRTLIYQYSQFDDDFDYGETHIQRLVFVNHEKKRVFYYVKVSKIPRSRDGVNGHKNYNIIEILKLPSDDYEIDLKLEKKESFL